MAVVELGWDRGKHGMCRVDVHVERRRTSWSSCCAFGKTRHGTRLRGKQLCRAPGVAQRSVEVGHVCVRGLRGVAAWVSGSVRRDREERPEGNRYRP